MTAPKKLASLKLKKRLAGLGWLILGISFFVVAYVSSTPSQREFVESVAVPIDSAKLAHDFIMNVVVPVVMVGLGLIGVCVGCYQTAVGIPQKDAEDFVDEWESDRLISEADSDEMRHSPLRTDGVYCIARGSVGARVC